MMGELELTEVNRSRKGLSRGRFVGSRFLGVPFSTSLLAACDYENRLSGRFAPETFTLFSPVWTLN